MRKRKTRVAWALLACAVAFGTATAPALAAPAAQHGNRTVTLITGDKVVVDGNGRVLTVQPAAGREKVGFSKSQQDGHTRVVPLDAAPLLAAGKLDPRLFDVTTLIEFGYEDGRQLPLIIGGQGVMAARSAENWQALTTGSQQISQKIWLDGIRKPVLDQSVKQIGAPAAHQAGWTGKGVKVAVLDTGVDANHPDLVGKQVAEKNFTSDPDATDKAGHGTHVGATIASGSTKYGGVAPDARLLDGKVCIEFGCQESWIIDGMNWAAEQGADVVNLSLGGPDSPDVDPVEEAVNTLSARYGTLFVIAAGNSGADEAVSSPGSADAALTVGAVDRNEQIAPFSSRGPRIGDGAIKPDVTAPGVGIVAAQAGTTGHIAYSGTSMATPHVAGAAALLKQQHPDWTGDQIKSLLTTTAKPNSALGVFDQGSGRIDLARAITQEVVSVPSNVAFGLQQWPHADDKTITKQVTYLNPTDQPITFDLRMESNAAAMFSLAANRVTVPAKGKASVALTADTRVGTNDGMFTGVVHASAGDVVVRTPFSVHREVESYDLTLEFLGRDGKPSPNNFFSVLPFNSTKTYTPLAQNGVAKMRLPKGRYLAYGFQLSGDGGFDMLVQPELVVHGDTKTTFDASKAKPIDVRFPEPEGNIVAGDITFQRRFDNGPRNFGVIAFGGLSNTRTLQVGPNLPPDELSTVTAVQANTTADNATFYRLAWLQAGYFPTGLTAAPRKEDLARVETRLGPFQAEHAASKAVLPSSDLVGGGGSAVYHVPDGKNAVDYVSPELKWEHVAFASTTVGAAHVDTLPKAYQAGKSYQELMFYAVYGPALPPANWSYSDRSGNDLYIGVPLFGDWNNGTGSSTVVSGRTALYRDDKLVEEVDSAGRARFTNLPPAAGAYRVETEAVRAPLFDTSTTVRTSWTFRSARAQDPVRTPLAVVKFHPKLDGDNALQAGRLHRVPLSVQQQGGGKYGPVDVEYSFDDGRTWRRAGVVGGSALIYHPDADGFISLRAKARDNEGNAVDQTIMRAYKVKK